MTVHEFITERRAGAKKIAEEAREQGGLALLTAVHFEAKDSAYALALNVVNGPFYVGATTYLREREQEAATIIATAGSMHIFQTWTGKQEVFGEIIVFLEHPKEMLV